MWVKIKGMSRGWRHTSGRASVWFWKERKNSGWAYQVPDGSHEVAWHQRTLWGATSRASKWIRENPRTRRGFLPVLKGEVPAPEIR
jgi:hypothetical protein